MFKFKFTIELLTVAALLMISWIVYQSNRIDALNQRVASQNDVIEQKQHIILQQEKVNAALQKDLESERQAVEKHELFVKELKEQADETRNTVRQMLKNEPCASTRLPAHAIERLRYHNAGTHAD